MCHLLLMKPWWTTSNKLRVLAATHLYCKILKRIYQMPSIMDICTLDTSDDKLLGNFWLQIRKRKKRKEWPPKKEILSWLIWTQNYFSASLQLRIANYNDCSTRISWIIIYYLFWMNDWLKKENGTPHEGVYAIYLFEWLCLLFL